MLDKEIKSELRRILRKVGRDPEIVNQKLSSKHKEGEMELLLQHISIIMEYLMFDAQASRSELFDMRKLIEDGGSKYGEQFSV